MKNSYEKLFTYLPQQEPSGQVLTRIMNKIHAREMASLRRSMVLYSLGFVGSLIVLFPAFRQMYNSLINSGFMEYFSLLFSDSVTVTSIYNNFIFVLLESLPVASITAFLVTTFVLLESLKYLFTHRVIHN